MTTMRALSSDDNKRFGPFSTTSNSANTDRDGSKEDNLENEVCLEENNRDGKRVEPRQIKSEIQTDIVSQTFGNAKIIDEHDPETVATHDSAQEDYTMDQDQDAMDEEDDLQRTPEDNYSYNYNDENTISKVNSTCSRQIDDEAQIQDMSDINFVPPDRVPIKSECPAEGPDNPNVWTLPERSECTLEEIRRGQVINKTAANECPVLGCGKKINEMRLEPSPGTIASGLRTHVLFVHYANRKMTKKRKLGWTNKRRSQPSPKKAVGLTAPSKQSFDQDSQDATNLTSGLDLTTLPSQAPAPGSLLSKKVKQLAKKAQISHPPTHQIPSLHSLMQATGGTKLPSVSPQPKQKNLDVNMASQKNFNPTTSSLFSILAGLTQQQQQSQQQQQQQPIMSQTQPSISRSAKTAHSTNTINMSQCSRSPAANSRTMNSSLLSLLNEKISGNVANSLQTQLKKSLGADQRSKIPSSAQRQNISSPANPFYQSSNNDSSYNNSTSILSSLCSDNSMPLNSFIESIAIKTGSNIGQAGIVEAKKIIEKFTSSLICSAQTIADHYIAPFAAETPQQKPEISPSDVMLAFKMMHKSHGQP